MKTVSILRYLTIATTLTVTPLSIANVEIRFRESAPKDIFSIQNLSKCDLQQVSLEIDLSDSAGRLIFDTTSAGAGVEVFQPFEVRQGNIILTSASDVKDGDTTLSVQIDQISAGETVSFTIDVDDTLAKSELGNIRVSGSEIEGGTVRLSLVDDEQIAATFINKSTALVPLQPNCPTNG